MAPLRGWGAKGKRLRGFAPYDHWRKLTVPGALRWDQLTTPCVFDGPIDRQCFRAYVEQQLVPVLEPGDVVIMDNLGSHKGAAVHQLIRSAGAKLLFLPPYSPDLNPIEQAFARSSTGCAALRSERSRTRGSTSDTSSQPSNPQNAQTTSKMRDTLPSKPERL